MKRLALIAALCASPASADTILFIADDHSDGAISQAVAIGGFAVRANCEFRQDELDEDPVTNAVQAHYFCLDSLDIYEMRNL